MILAIGFVLRSNDGREMATANARAYLSPTLVLLALDWPDGATRQTFSGLPFAARQGSWTWRPVSRQRVVGCRTASRLMVRRLQDIWIFRPRKPRFRNSCGGSASRWLRGWRLPDVRGHSRGRRARCTAADYRGYFLAHPFVPQHVAFDIGTWFNRAVISSEVFSRKLHSFDTPPGQLTDAQKLHLRLWLRTAWRRLCQISWDPAPPPLIRCPARSII